MNSMTREGLAIHLFNRIAAHEGQDVSRLPREYALNLIREVVSAIDNAAVQPPVYKATVNSGFSR